MSVDLDTSHTICRQDSPNRCTEITPEGQCNNESRAGTKFCPRHSRMVNSTAQKKNVLELYQFQGAERMREFANSNVMSLKAEVSILRQTLEMLMGSFKGNAANMLLSIGPITKLTGDIGNLLATMDRINMNSGNLLDLEEVTQIAQEIVQAIALEITDPGILSRLSTAIQQIILAKVSVNS